MNILSIIVVPQSITIMAEEAIISDLCSFGFLFFFKKPPAFFMGLPAFPLHFWNLVWLGRPQVCQHFTDSENSILKSRTRGTNAIYTQRTGQPKAL